ncbi:MAG: leucine-rich repeat protein [Clostridiales bacterium]|nr:leucine-rich repeat protein [Clostridiales bacterium]
MNKCFKCGTEFEGKFCPECGQRFIEQSEANQPAGGATSQSSESVNVSYEFSAKFYQNLHKALNLLPIAFFALFSLLNWVFMSCQAASMTISWGNIYTMTSDYTFHAVANALIVLSAVSCVVAIAYFMIYSLRKTKKLKLAVTAIAYAMYFCILVTACVLYVAINNDGLQVETATKLMITFSVVFVAISVLLTLIDILLAKHHTKYASALVQMLSTPTFMQKVAHSYKSWISGGKTVVVVHGKKNAKTESYNKRQRIARTVGGVILALIVVCVLVFGIIVPVTTSEFYINTLEKINIGDSKENVEKLLGEADQKSNSIWIYYGQYLDNHHDKETALNEWASNMENIEDMEVFFDVSTKIEEKAQQINDKLLIVSFDGSGRVAGVSMETHSNNSDSSSKEVKKITLGNRKNVIDVVDISNGTVAVRTYYNDGSFSMSALPSDASVSNMGDSNSRLFPDSATISWSDAKGDHSQQVKFDESNFIFSWKYINDANQLNLYGTIPSRSLYQFFHMGNFPWADKTVKQIWIDSSVTNIPNISSIVNDESILENIIVDDNNPYYSSLQGILLNKEKTEIIYVPPMNNNLPSVIYYISSDGLIYVDNVLYGYKGNMPANFALEIQEGTVAIAANAFENQANLTSITLPESLKTIGYGAFKDCTNLHTVNWNAISCDILLDVEFSPIFNGCESLEEINIGNKVTTIPKYAFYYCSGLKSITIPKNVVSIGYGAFDSCTGLESITIPFVGAALDDTSQTHFGYIFGASHYYENSLTVPSSLKEVIITGGKSIDSYAFYQCMYLTTITIPTSVQSIGFSSFTSCDNLKTVYYCGTKGQWLQLTGHIYLSNKTRYYYSVVNPYENGTAVDGDNYWHWAEDGVTHEIWTDSKETSFII